MYRLITVKTCRESVNNIEKNIKKILLNIYTFIIVYDRNVTQFGDRIKLTN